VKRNKVYGPAEVYVRCKSKGYKRRYYKTATISLNFKNPNQIVEEYFSKYKICLANEDEMQT